MLTYPADQSPAAVRSLFHAADLPAGVRCLAAFEGYLRGEVVTDSADHATWAIMREHIYGTLYLAGAISEAPLANLITHYAVRGETLIGVWPSDPLPANIPPPQYEGTVLDFTDRAGSLSDLLHTIPESCTLHRMDADLLARSANAEDLIKTYSSFANAAEKETAFCLIHADTLVCEASAAPLSSTLMEVGMVTHPDHRRRGYATYLCAYLIDHCEQLGFATYWNCNAENIASAIIARKLGYQQERPYHLIAWWPA